ncbi:MAG: LTA synthase family protein [Firmicutes bacterium]|nr:LTA synthase family protein [Bacillota bacterium]
MQKTSELFKKNAVKLLIALQPVWLEFFMHAMDGSSLRFAPIYILYGGAFGALLMAVCSALSLKLKEKVLRIAGKTFSVLLWVLFCVEFIAKRILQTYFPASILATASENRLGDYFGQIVKTTVGSIPSVIVLAVPTVLLFILWSRKRGEFGKTSPRFIAVYLAAFAAFHLGGLAVVNTEWPVDLQPRTLYNSDTNFNDQVEELGLVNFLRLDIKHSLFPGTVKGEEFVAVAPPPPVIEKQQPAPSKTDDPRLSATDETGPAEPPAPVIDTSPNVMDVDLAAVSESAKSKDVKWLADYFASVTPTNKNEYTGRYKDYNVIVLCLEAFSGYAMSEEYTPTLWKLAHEGYQFTNFYTALHYTSTSNGECQVLLGLYPKNGNPISMKRTGEKKTNCYFSLAPQLGRLGYHNIGFHNNWDLYGRNASHTNLGYEWHYANHGLELEWSGKSLLWPQRDSVMIENSVDQYVNDEGLFNVYYMTISGHTPWEWNYSAAPYREQLADLEYSETTKAYIATCMELDKAFAELLKALEEAGKLENTLIVACADHVPYTGVEILEEISEKEFGSSKAVEAINEQSIDFDLYKNTLFIWAADIEEPVVIDKVCCQVDVLPTVSNLLGLEYDSRMLAGTDIFSDSEGLVVFSSRCWKSDKGFYDRFRQTFTPAEGVEMTEEETKVYVDYMKASVDSKLAMTPKIIESDFYNILFGE